jgi:hypothetical protein
MPKSFPVLLALATLSLGANAQMTDPTVAAPPQSQPAPIVRGYAGRQATTSEPTNGVWVRSEPSGSVKTVSASANGAEIRVEHGRVNVQVYHPADHAQITVDLPGGQIDLLKDGFYTFNAETNTVRVLRGEAETYPGGAASNSKPIKVKEDHQYAFSGKPAEVDPQQLMSDVLPGGGPGRGDGRGDGYGPGYGPGYGYAPGYANGPYGDGYYGYPSPYPYYAYGYPYGYGFGYPFGFGLGFGYYGGFGGFRGGHFGHR